jgi:ribonucleoside-diphosphate reductase alpha chain
VGTEDRKEITLVTQLTQQAETVASSRYYLKDENNEVIETADDMFERVGQAIAKVDMELYGKLAADAALTAVDFTEMMKSLKFIPNSPTLMNAGTEQGTLSACFVLPLKDSMEDIMKTAHDIAMVQKFGGGTGFALSELRPRGDRIKTTHGIACGPIQVLQTLSRVSSMITQGGKRDGANMAVMSVYHPDILEFIDCKKVEGEIHNFNISVGVDADFMKAVEANLKYPLINPKSKQVVGELNAREVFDKIVYGAWRNGEPGMIFLDNVNKDNHVKAEYGEMIATNPCGEQPLLGNESCNLGSINLAKFYHDDHNDVDWRELEKTVKRSVHFLDNVIDANKYATPEIEKMTKSTRKIGLGVMGFADLLIQLKIKYNSIEGRKLGKDIMSFIRDKADAESKKIANERGTFPAWNESDYGEDEKYRNACRLTVAPTGTISMLADTSSGIEPTFALAWKKSNILEGQTLYYVNKYFEADAKRHDFYSEDLMEHLSQGGSLQTREDVPPWAKDIYITAPEISAEDHVEMQAAFQEDCDSGISKTINFPNEATIADVEAAYVHAWKLGCKGITVYRAGSREIEVLVKGTEEKEENDSTEQMSFFDMVETPEPAYDCCESPNIAMESGCETCKVCGWSMCHVA